MKILSLLLILLALCAIFTAFAADDKTDDEPIEVQDEETEAAVVEETLSSSDVSTIHFFPKGERFILGEGIVVLLGLSNSGDKTFNVSHIRGSLRYLQDWKYAIQNYTTILYDQLVAPNEQASFAYPFFPDPFLEPRPYGLQVDVFYHDSEGNNFTTTFYNSTIQLYETDDVVDAQTLFTYVGVLAVGGLILFVAYKSTRPTQQKVRARKQPVEVGTKQVIQSEWLEGTAAATRSPSRARSPPKQRKTATVN